MLETAREVLTLLKAKGVLTLTPTRDQVPSLVGLVAGDVRGSWWGHPRGSLVFNIATALEERPDVLVAKLVAGKVTFVHAALFAPLFRVVTDAAFVARALAGIPVPTARLHARVDREGTLREDEFLGDAGPDAKRAHKKQRDALEKRALLLSQSEHTHAGHHATVLRSWNAWATPQVKEAAALLDYDGAHATLKDHGLDF